MQPKLNICAIFRTVQQKLNKTPLKKVDDFAYLGSNIASTKKDVLIRKSKAWYALADYEQF